MTTDGEVKVVVGRCPACDTRIRFQERPRQYQLLRCPECGKSLEVVREQPLRLDWAAEESLDY